jgi:23S rRNA pseudouridine955/2504/2580 synthase
MNKEVSKQKKQFSIAYEDNNLIIVSKPFGLLTHGDSFEKKKTLANQVMGYLIEKGEYDPAEKSFAPAPANRLDRNTTGLVIFGKTSAALKNINLMLKERNHIRKYYSTIVFGEIKKDLILSGKLIKDTAENKASILAHDDGEGKDIKTIARVIEKAKGFTLIEVELVTGRPHQIRAHLAHEGYPIIGDLKYGSKKLNSEISKKYGLTTQVLHAEKLYFDEMAPYFQYMSGVTVKAELPAEFIEIKQKIFTI